MKSQEYHHQLGATAACSVRMAEATVHCGQPGDTTSRNLFAGDSWFASVKTAEEIYTRGSEFIGPVKTAKKLFPIKEIERIMKNWPRGTHVVLEGQGLKETPLLAIGYKYNARKCLSFIATKNAGKTTLGRPYRARFTDKHDNVEWQEVDRPEVLADYFLCSNAVDKHNHARQSLLKLETHWVVHDPFFRVGTTLIGMTATDAWKAFKYSIEGSHPDKDISIVDFTGRLAYDCLFNTYQDDFGSPVKNLPPLPAEGDHTDSESPAKNTRGHEAFARRISAPVRALDLTSMESPVLAHAAAPASHVLTTPSRKTTARVSPSASLPSRTAYEDVVSNTLRHQQVSRKRNRCDARDPVTNKRTCTMKSNLYCSVCNKGPYCRPKRGRSCWDDHCNTP